MRWGCAECRRPAAEVATPFRMEKTSNPGAGKKFKYPASAPGVSCQLWLLAIARTFATLVVLGCCLVATDDPAAGLMAGAGSLVIAILLWSWSPKAS